MKIGIIKEGKNPPDKRVPFTPEQCSLITARYPNSEVLVQESMVRAFSDEDYRNNGVEVVEQISYCEVLFGVKEVNIEDLIPNKTYFFFSHTIKKQPYNRDLLKAILEKNIKLVDYECLTDQNGLRLVGFGRYAGIVGCYNGLLAYGKRTRTYELKAANLCHDKKELISVLKKVQLPDNFRIAITGLGRVASGAIEILTELGIKKVDPSAYLSEQYDEAVYTQLSVEDYFKRSDGKSFTREEVYDNPEGFESDFMKFAKETDLYISCHFWDSRGPVIFSAEDMATDEFRISTVADISCDIDGPIPSTIRPSTIADPIYQVKKSDRSETTEVSEMTITVMAVDNLPCELPRDASEGFGEELLQNVLPNLLGSDQHAVIERATIAENGALKPNYDYLQDYVNGLE